MAKILLVDNDPLQAFVHKSLLIKDLHDVHRVRNAAEALCTIEQAEFSPDLTLIICSRTIHGLSCPEFVRELSIRSPQMKILVLEKAPHCACDYPAQQVQFASQPLEAEEILRLTDGFLNKQPSAA